MLRIPHCLDNRLANDGKVVSPTHRNSPQCILKMEAIKPSEMLVSLSYAITLKAEICSDMSESEWSLLFAPQPRDVQLILRRPLFRGQCASCAPHGGRERKQALKESVRL
jgi:hypothetical protein